MSCKAERREWPLSLFHKDTLVVGQPPLQLPPQPEVHLGSLPLYSPNMTLPKVTGGLCGVYKDGHDASLAL